MADCEICRTFEDLIKEIRPNKILYTTHTALALAMEKVLKEHKDRAHETSQFSVSVEKIEKIQKVVK